MKSVLFLFLLIAVFETVFSQNAGSLYGKVTDKLTNGVLPGATITVKGSIIVAVADNGGYFMIGSLPVGKVLISVSYVGYVASEILIDIKVDRINNADISLLPDERAGTEAVVSAFKRPEKITNAAASIHVIGRKALSQFAGSNVGELFSKIQGVEFVRTGVDGMTFNARGFNSAFNNKVMHLVDGRINMGVGSGSLPLFNNSSINKDDIERIEIVLGPQSALYGPNAHNAVINYISKDPRRYQGTTVSVSAGNRYQFSGRMRHAAKINDKWTYKLSGEYAAGKDFVFFDSVYAGGGVFGPAKTIPERNVDFDFRHLRGEAYLYYSVTPKTDIIISGGGSSNSFLQVTTAMRNQMQGLTFGYLQAKVVNPHFYVDIYNGWGTLGTSYLIGNYTRDFWNRTNSTITNPSDPRFPTQGRLSPDSAEAFALRYGNRFREENQRLNADAQYNYTFENTGLFIVAGANYQKDKPNAFGITLADSANRIYVTQYGAVLQLEKKLPFRSRFIGAARWDHHSNFGNFISPKFSLLRELGDGNIRVSWARAFAMPSILAQYSKISNNIFGNGNGVWYIPNGAKFSTASENLATPLKPEQVSTWEIGYKGTIAKKLFVDLNYYNGKSKNFLSPGVTVQGRATRMGDIPITPVNPGVVINDTLKGASFITYFNYAEVRAYGIDFGINYAFNDKVSIDLKYSWFDSDITDSVIKNDANKDGIVSPDERSLNAPHHRGAITLNFQNLFNQKFFFSLSGRFVQEYDFYSGAQIGTSSGKGKRGIISRPPPLAPILKNFDWGPLGGFATFDIFAGYRMNEMVSVNMSITNLLDTEQIEFVASPSIRRLIMLELKVHVPSSKKR